MKIKIKLQQLNKFKKALQNLAFLIQHDKPRRISTIYTEKALKCIESILDSITTNSLKHSCNEIDIDDPNDLSYFKELYDLLEKKGCPLGIEDPYFDSYLTNKKHLDPVISIIKENDFEFSNNKNPYIDHTREAEFERMREEARESFDNKIESTDSFFPIYHTEERKGIPRKASRKMSVLAYEP